MRANGKSVAFNLELGGLALERGDWLIPTNGSRRFGILNCNINRIGSASRRWQTRTRIRRSLQPYSWSGVFVGGCRYVPDLQKKMLRGYSGLDQTISNITNSNLLLRVTSTAIRLFCSITNTGSPESIVLFNF